MFKASLQAAFNKAHNPEYQFFREYESLSGWAVIVGFNNGHPMASLRIYNKSLSIVLFEQDVFLEDKIKSARWVLGEEFDYHITALGEVQEAQTLFVPKKSNKLVKNQATFVEEDVADLIEKGYELKAEQRKARRGADEDTDSTRLAGKQVDTGTNPFVKQIGFFTQPLDNFKLAPHLVIVEDTQINSNFLNGASRTLLRNKATLMLPNQIPLIIEAIGALSKINYRAYCYDARKDTLEPFREEAKSRSVFFVHEAIFLADEAVKLRP